MLDNDIKTLISILEKSNIDELEVSTFWGKQKIRIRKSFSINDQSISSNDKLQNQVSIEENIIHSDKDKAKNNDLNKNDIANAVVHEESTDLIKNTITIKAPLVGTFYISPRPDSPPFIAEGDQIKEGQIICIIEAMKIFNEIESEYSGKVIKILVENGTPIEYDQDLLIISSD